MSFEPVKKFEDQVASFFGSPYAVAVDCCTHALELCLRMNDIKYYTVPKRTYISVPFLANKLGISFDWRDEDWKEYYYLGGTNIIDAAVLWEKNSYIKGTFMCISFQFQKHLNIGKGGMILTDDKGYYNSLKKMSYDGRLRNIPWRSQNIESLGYHYYMPPESAAKGTELFNKKKDLPPKKWTYEDYPDLSNMTIFSKK